MSRLNGTFIMNGSVRIVYFLLEKLPAACDEPEIKTASTDFNKRKTFSEGL
jgi:hypothetical protein